MSKRLFESKSPNSSLRRRLTNDNLQTPEPHAVVEPGAPLRAPHHAAVDLPMPIELFPEANVLQTPEPRAVVEPGAPLRAPHHAAVDLPMPIELFPEADVLQTPVPRAVVEPGAPLRAPRNVPVRVSRRIFFPLFDETST
jgi:hypothetical protein